MGTAGEAMVEYKEKGVEERYTNRGNDEEKIVERKKEMYDTNNDILYHLVFDYLSDSEQDMVRKDRNEGGGGGEGKGMESLSK